MVDPFTGALAVYKSVKLVSKAKELAERFGSTKTQRFIERRDEMHREWSAETAGRLAENIRESAEKFALLGGAIEEHAERLEELLDREETQVLAGLYTDASYREAIKERRRMLSFAAASIADLDVTLEEKASVERVLRELEPSDVLELHRISRTVGTIERGRRGFGEKFPSTGALRYALLSESKSDDALSAARCVRETLETSIDEIGNGHPVAHVTERGHAVLSVLQKYIDEKHDAFVGEGRGELPGSRSDVEARKALAAYAPLLRTLEQIRCRMTAQKSWWRPVFQRPETKIAGSHHPGANKVTEPPARSEATLSLSELDDQSLAAIGVPDEGGELIARVEEISEGRRRYKSVIVRGPFDLVRWVADDLDAWWRETT